MELKEFQLNAVKSLFEAMDKPVRDIILKSPTGSGKTIILTYFMHQYIQSYPKTVFVWLTPGKGNLEEQSKAKMDKYIHASQTKLLSDVMTAGFEENDSCFINWEKLTKKGNNALKDSERTNFLEHIEHALNDGLRFIIIVDESHQNNTIKADEIIQYFRTEKIIRCSATPKGIAKAEVIEIPEEEVIAAGLIKKMLVINQDFPQTVETEDQTAYLLERALQKQRELRAAYLQMDVDVNPLIIVQIPNKSETLLDGVERWFEAQGLTYENSQLAVWLSDRHENLEGIERQEENKMVAGHLTLKNGKYYAVLNYKNAGGQRKTKWISLGLSEKGNKRKAEAELARLRAEFEPPKEAGDLSSDMLFADYLLEWLEIAKGRLAHATYGAYQGLLKSTIVPYFRKKKLTLRELEARHLQMFYSEMLRRVTPNTVIHYHAVIHSALKYAVKTDMLIQNVADKVDRPRKNSFQPVFLSADEMQKMFEALRGTKLELPVLVAAFYGLRRGEVVGLKWDAIDFEQGTISVKRTVTSTIIDGKYQEFEQQSAKTKSSLRTLPLIGSFREYFMQVKEAQELNKQVCGNCYNYEYDGFVFVDELGERMRVEYLTNAFPKFLESHGLRRMRFHDLRHSCASLLLANGVPLKHIQEWLGHSDFTTTANIYAHLDYKSKITSAQAMETGLALPEGGDFSSRWSSISAGENS